MRTVEHICFDKDGTLIDVHLYWSDIITKRAKRMAEQYGLQQQAVADLCKAMGVDPVLQRILPGGPVGYKPRPVIIDAARTTLGRWNVNVAAEDIAAVFVAVDQWMQENSSYEIRLLSEVKSSLQELKRAGLKMSVYTSDRRENLNKFVKMLDLESYFDALVGGDDVKKAKPHPEGFLIACDRVGVKAGESVYVGDTVDDMHMGKEAHAAACIGITTGLDSSEQLLLHARYVIQSLNQLPEMLKGI